MKKLLSLGDIAKRLNVPFHRVRYAVEAVDMQPVQRIGIVRLWSEGQVPQIKAALKHPRRDWGNAIKQLPTEKKE